MKKNIVRLLCVAGAVFWLAGCHTLRPDEGAGVVNANQASEEGAQTAGMGAEAALSDRGWNAPSAHAPEKQTYHFDFDQDAVHQEDMAGMTAQGKYLATHPSAQVRLEGNTDERGSREYNVALGWRRVKAVSSVLKQEGASPKQIEMVSYGAEKPVALGHDEKAWAQNRRVELSYRAE